MKHKPMITIVLLLMFLITQFIGLAVIHAYSPIVITQINPETGETRERTILNPLPFGLEPPQMKEEQDFWKMLPSLIIAFIIAIMLILIFSKYKWKFLIRVWFFVVVAMALGICLATFFKFILKVDIATASVVAMVFAIPASYFKIYKPNVILHNLTEFLIYPGIAAVFVPILNIWTIIFLLILISAYDMWAVWHSGIMQKMAKFQMNELKVLGGFLVPYVSKNLQNKIKKWKLEALKSKAKARKLKNKKIKVSMAILGGGDVVFPIIASGVFLRAFGFVSALFVIGGALAGLGFLLLYSEKKKFYPAMPFITTGIFLGMILWLVLVG